MLSLRPLPSGSPGGGAVTPESSAFPQSNASSGRWMRIRLAPARFFTHQKACLPLCLFESIFSLTLQLILLTDGPFHTALYAGTASILTLSRTCAAAVLLYSPRCAAGGSVFGALASDVIIIDTVALLAEHLVFFVHVIETYYVRDADALPTWQVACLAGVVYMNAVVLLSLTLLLLERDWSIMKRKSPLVGMRACKQYRSRGQEPGESCVICLEDFKPRDRVVQLPCEHTFHFNCAKKWLNDGKGCPFRCRPPPRSRSRTPSRSPSHVGSETPHRHESQTPRSERLPPSEVSVPPTVTSSAAPLDSGRESSDASPRAASEPIGEEHFQGVVVLGFRETIVSI